jgi:hypothetical protein
VKSIYLLPGRGGRLTAGLGLALKARGYHLSGRETLGDFAKLPLPHQAQAIADDLQTAFWDSSAHVIANSYGAYLLLFAQTFIPAFPGKVLLLSPVIGDVSQSSIGNVGFAPPYADRLMGLARLGELVVPEHCEIHVGANDWQCPAERLSEFGRLTGVPVTIVPDAGHMLDHGYMNTLLDQWLT